MQLRQQRLRYKPQNFRAIVHLVRKICQSIDIKNVIQKISAQKCHLVQTVRICADSCKIPHSEILYWQYPYTQSIFVRTKARNYPGNMISLFSIKTVIKRVLYYIWAEWIFCFDYLAPYLLKRENGGDSFKATAFANEPVLFLCTCFQKKVCRKH